MFSLFYKPKKEFVRIYEVRDDKNGYPHFLIYDDSRQWKYISAKYFADEAEWD